MSTYVSIHRVTSVKAGVYSERTKNQCLTFSDGQGGKVDMWIPPAIAVGMAAAFDAHQNAEPTHDPDFTYPRPEPIDFGESE